MEKSLSPPAAHLAIQSDDYERHWDGLKPECCARHGLTRFLNFTITFLRHGDLIASV
jgi:hypothetical protein